MDYSSLLSGARQSTLWGLRNHKDREFGNIISVFYIYFYSSAIPNGVPGTMLKIKPRPPACKACI